METIPETLAGLRVPIEDLKPYGRNPRRGDVEVIAGSLQHNGQYRPIVVNSRTNEVLAGNHTLAAAQQLGWREIAATFVDADEEQAKRIVLVDNRANDLAGYDDPELAALLDDLGAGNLAGTGFSDADLAQLLSDVAEPPPALTDPDDVPVIPKKPRSQLGDIWELGDHRVICADATDPATYDALLDEERIDLVWTDPPYGVAYVGKTKEALTIQNDEMDLGALTEFLLAAFAATLAVTRPGAIWYVTAPHGPAGHSFGAALTDVGVWRHSLVWVKDSLVMGRGDYHYRHEAIFYGWTPGAARLHPVPDRKQDTVWEIPRPKASREHPTMKPIALVDRSLQNSSTWGGLVLDPFAGSGSTLIACQDSGRRARCAELDPRYVDVICRRFQEHTGTMPIRDGDEVDFTGGSDG